MTTFWSTLTRLISALAVSSPPSPIEPSVLCPPATALSPCLCDAEAAVIRCDLAANLTSTLAAVAANSSHSHFQLLELVSQTRLDDRCRLAFPVDSHITFEEVSTVLSRIFLH